MSWTIRSATREDIADLVGFLGTEIRDVSDHTVWQIPWTWQHYMVAHDADGRLIAAGSLQPLYRGKVELRGLAVADACRGHNLGRAIVENLIARAAARGQEILCVTRTPGFFRRFGFRDTLPAWLERGRGMAALVPPSPRIAMVFVPEVAAC